MFLFADMRISAVIFESSFLTSSLSLHHVVAATSGAHKVHRSELFGAFQVPATYAWQVEPSEPKVILWHRQSLTLPLLLAECEARRHCAHASWENWASGVLADSIQFQMVRVFFKVFIVSSRSWSARKTQILGTLCETLGVTQHDASFTFLVLVGCGVAFRQSNLPMHNLLNIEDKWEKNEQNGTGADDALHN